MASKTFLVRNADTREAVGLFCARHSNELFCLLDERCDPFECEYLELNAGEGVFAAPRLPVASGQPCLHPTEALGTRLREKSGWRPLSLAGFQPSHAWLNVARSLV